MIYREWSEKEKISSERQLCGQKRPFWCQKRMGRLVRDDRKTTLTQITSRFNQGIQNTISEHTTHRTLKQMDYSSRRPHRVPLRSTKNRKRRIQFTLAHQNWTIEDWKNVVWSDESRFLLRHSDGRVRILPCLNGSDKLWWCNGVGNIFLAHFGPLSSNWSSFKRHTLPEYYCWPCPSLYDYNVPFFWCYFQQDNEPSQSFLMETRTFSSLYRFSIGLMSGDWLGHSRTLMCFFLSHSFVALVVCFGSLSCWKLHPRPIFSVLAEGRRFSSNILWYLAPSIGPSMRRSHPVPLAEKQLQKHDVSTSMLDCRDGVLGVIVSISLLPNTTSWVDAKELNFGLTWPQHILPSLLWII